MRFTHLAFLVILGAVVDAYHGPIPPKRPTRPATAPLFVKSKSNFLKHVQRISRARQGLPPLEEEEAPLPKKKRKKKKVSVTSPASDASTHRDNSALAYPAMLAQNWFVELTKEKKHSNVFHSDQAAVETTVDEPSPKPLVVDGEWTAYWDEHGTGYVYYFNEATGESQWQPPTETFPAIELDSKMKSVLDDDDDDDQDAVENTIQELASQGDWKAYFDGIDSNMVYYHNTKTGVSQWNKPTKDFPSLLLTPAMKKRMVETRKDSHDWTEVGNVLKGIGSLVQEHIERQMELHDNNPFRLAGSMANFLFESGSETMRLEPSKHVFPAKLGATNQQVSKGSEIVSKVEHPWGFPNLGKLFFDFDKE